MNQHFSQLIVIQSILLRLGRSKPDFESWDSRCTGAWENARLGISLRHHTIHRQK